MNNKQEKLITRREFLKNLSGAAAGLAVTIALPKVSKADSITSKLNDMLDDGDKVRYIDSLGREIEIPETIISVIPSGIFAQTMLMMLCPERLSSLARPIMESDINDYERAGLKDVLSLDRSGELYPEGGEENLDYRAIADQSTEVILDMGSHKDGQSEAYSVIKDETGKVTVFIDATVGNLGNAFREVGELLQCEDRAGILAAFIEKGYTELSELGNHLESEIKIFYAPGHHGLERHPGYSFQDEVIRMLGFIPVEAPFSLEERLIDQSYLPGLEADCILFNDWESFKNIVNLEGEDYEIWKDTPAISSGRFAVAPGLFQSWIGTPFVQMIGAWWIGNIVAPDVFNYDMVQKTREFYRLFYNYEISEDEVYKLLGYDSMNKDKMNIG